MKSNDLSKEIRKQSTEKQEFSAPGKEDMSKFFDTEYLKADLKGRSIRGGVVTMTAQGVKFFLQMGSTVVLARLLTPEDYGLIAMVAVVTNFAVMFKDMGLSMATVQKADIDHAQISTLFWINVVISLIIMAIMAALAPVVSWFYGKPELALITLALAGTFVFSGLTIQHQALLRRQMHFGRLAIIEITAIFGSVIAAIISAWYGAGYWALVIMQLVMAVSTAIGVWFACDWRPGLPKRGTGVRPMLAFGKNITSFNLINYFARNSDKILVGRFCGSGVLGLYSKAYNLLMLPISQICGPLTSVAVPALSRIQDDPKRYTSYYSKLILLISFVSMPLIVFLAICSKSVIYLLMGDQWLGMSSIFQILAITAFIQPVSTTVGLVLLSLGQSGRFLRFGIFNGLAVVTSFAVGLHWGAIGVASAYAVASYLILFPTLWYCFRLTPISIAIFLKAIIRPIMASFIMALAMLLARPFLVGQLDIVAVCTNFGIGLSAYFLVWFLMPGGIQTLRDFIRHIRLIF
jgi:O-antigen/teichoic acid export membrane protein